MPKVSVIIPVYGVERYMERAARSIFGQTLDDIEYVFVDDCTPDASMSVMRRVLKEYPERRSQVREIRMPVNSKLAAARGAGMKAASGRFMIPFDPDDYLDSDYLQSLYQKAREENAQICTAPISYERADGPVKVQKRFRGKGFDALKSGENDWHVWAMLFDSELIHTHSIYPFDGLNCGEDVNVAMRAYRYAERVTYTESDAAYHYNLLNEGSITHRPYRENFELYLRENVRLLNEFFAPDGADGRRIMDIYKFRVKLPFWSVPEDRDIDLWYRLWPEANHIMSEQPGVSFPLRLLAKVPARLSFLFKLYLRYIDWRTR